VALKVPEASSVAMLEALRLAVMMDYDLRLYSNNHTPADGDDVTDYTECTFPGYAAIGMSTWSAAALNADGKAETSEVTQTFTGGAIITPQNIYGIFVTDLGGDLVYAELNPGGVVSMAVAGQTYSYLPRFTLASEF